MLIQASVITWRMEALNSKARCTSSSFLRTSANSSASSGVARSRSLLCQPPPFETTRPVLCFFRSRQNFSILSLSRRRDSTARKLMKIGMMLIMEFSLASMFEAGQGKPGGAVHLVRGEPKIAADDLRRGNPAELGNGRSIGQHPISGGGGIDPGHDPAAMTAGIELVLDHLLAGAVARGFILYHPGGEKLVAAPVDIVDIEPLQFHPPHRPGGVGQGNDLDG